VAPLLSRVSVLDLSIWRPGPYATSLLAGLGADVLKVEPPGGDPMRQYPELFESVNAGKRSVVLNLKDPTDRARALELAAAADVVVEGFRPGVMSRLGMDEGAVRLVNPGVVYCSISGYGQEGPLAEAPGHDINYQAWAGALAPDGGTAAMPPLPLADLASGMTAAFGICAALLGRSGSGDGDGDGVGTYLDVSMTDVMATWTGSGSAATAGDDGAADGDAKGEGWSGTGAAESATKVPGYGLFTTADGLQVALGVVSEQHFWSALCGALGLDGLADVPFSERMERGQELGAAVERAVLGRGRAEVVSSLLAAGVPVAPVLDRAGMVANAPFPIFPIRLGGAGQAGAHGAGGAVPALGQHQGEGFRARAARPG
jgi:crotonobetainyl-CoA:carnitine CoA-transferase CaiB-like acyl-CoA transferase